MLFPHLPLISKSLHLIWIYYLNLVFQILMMEISEMYLLFKKYLYMISNWPKVKILENDFSFLDMAKR